MIRTDKTPTAICRYCSQCTPAGECSCTDHKKCKDCNIPRCVLLTDTRGRASR